MDDLARHGRKTSPTYDAELAAYLKSPPFEAARIRIATLDKAHFSLFSSRKDKAFSARLRCFVLDEAHTYDGVFGANVHYFIRRLYLASQVQGSRRPSMFLASATLAAARQFAATLLSLDEREIAHIEDNIKQQIELIPAAEVPKRLSRPCTGEMTRVVLLLDDPSGKSSVTTFLGDTDLVGKQVNAIYFSQSKFHSKVVAKRLPDNGDGSARQTLHLRC